MEAIYSTIVWGIGLQQQQQQQHQQRDLLEEKNYTESNETIYVLNNNNTINTTYTIIDVPSDKDTYKFENYYVMHVICIILNALAMSFCLISLIFVIYYRKNPIISKAQPRTYARMIMATLYCCI